MLDTLRLRANTAQFSSQVIARLRLAQDRRQTVRFDPDKNVDQILWVSETNVRLPSWFPGFYLQIQKNVVYLEASPKIYQGHNVDGSSNLLESASLLVSTVFGILGCAPGTYPAGGDWLVARMDITDHRLFESRDALRVFLDHAAGVSIGVRRTGTECEAEGVSYDGIGDGRTVYRGKHSRYISAKMYSKATEIMRHPPQGADPESLAVLAESLAHVLRLEAVVRSRWLTKNAVRLGLLDQDQLDFVMTAHKEQRDRREFAGSWSPTVLENLGFHVTDGKDPIIYFPVQYLHENLDLNQIWANEFAPFLASEATMTNDDLLKNLELVTTPGRAKAAFDFYLRVKSLGYASARATVTKTTYYRHRQLLGLVGVTELVLQTGTFVQDVPKVIRVMPYSPDRALLRKIQGDYLNVLELATRRLHAECTILAA